MPHVIVKLWPGKSDSQKRRLARAIADDVMTILDYVFTPSDEEIAWARRIVAAFADRPALGVIALDGKVVDRPHVRLAERLLARL